MTKIQVFLLAVALASPAIVLLGVVFGISTFRTSHTAPAPDFGCTQTISSTDARRIASDLHRYSSEGDSVEFYFECQDKFTVIRLDKAK